MRLLTRSDFDGLVCAVLLVEKGIVNEYTFVQPKDVQDGEVKATSNDVLANIPFVSGCGLWFDHHASENERLVYDVGAKGDSRPAPSCAQVIWDYYGGEGMFGRRLAPLLEAVNKSDSGDLTREEILKPKGWILLSFIMDPRTGLGRFSDFRISNYRLMEDLIQYCRTKPVEDILAIPDVKERAGRYFEQQDLHVKMLREHATVHGNLVVTDLRPCETIYAGNRFLIFALYPEQNIELRILWTKQKQRVMFTCGHSILNRTSKVNVAKLMIKYAGGGHEKVGACQVVPDNAEGMKRALIEQLCDEA